MRGMRRITTDCYCRYFLLMIFSTRNDIHANSEMEKICNRDKLIPLLLPHLVCSEPKPILRAVCFPTFLEEIYLVLRIKAILSTCIRRKLSMC